MDWRNFIVAVYDNLGVFFACISIGSHFDNYLLPLPALKVYALTLWLRVPVMFVFDCGLFRYCWVTVSVLALRFLHACSPCKFWPISCCLSTSVLVGFSVFAFRLDSG